jgi:hypothetical protein
MVNVIIMGMTIGARASMRVMMKEREMMIDIMKIDIMRTDIMRTDIMRTDIVRIDIVRRMKIDIVINIVVIDRMMKGIIVMMTKGIIVMTMISIMSTMKRKRKRRFVVLEHRKKL